MLITLVSLEINLDCAGALRHLWACWVPLVSVLLWFLSFPRCHSLKLHFTGRVSLLRRQSISCIDQLTHLPLCACSWLLNCYFGHSFDVADKHAPIQRVSLTSSSCYLWLKLSCAMLESFLLASKANLSVEAIWEFFGLQNWGCFTISSGQPQAHCFVERLPTHLVLIVHLC